MDYLLTWQNPFSSLIVKVSSGGDCFFAEANRQKEISGQEAREILDTFSNTVYIERFNGQTGELVDKLPVSLNWEDWDYLEEIFQNAILESNEAAMQQVLDNFELGVIIRRALSNYAHLFAFCETDYDRLVAFTEMQARARSSEVLPEKEKAL